MAMLPQPPSFDKHLALLESHPLFMSSLPDDPTDNVALSALQSLAHDGTPDGKCVSSYILHRPDSHEFGMATRGRTELQGTGK